MFKIAVIIKWDLPDTSEVTFDKTYIYRSTSETGSYSDLANQVIADNTYTDMEGSTSNWYKVRFYDSDNTIWSAYSEPTQGGSDYGYCSPDDVYNITPLSTSDVSYTEVSKLLVMATARLNSEINVRIQDEKVGHINREKENTQDSSNTTFYTKSFPIGDLDNDGEIGTGDIEAYSIDSEGTRTTLTVSSIDTSTIGKFSLSAAPSSSVDIYLTYAYVPLDAETPHPLILQACAFLVAAMSTTKIGSDNFKTLSLGRMRFSKFSPEYTLYMDRYYELVDMITDVGFREKGKSLIEMI